MIFLHLIYFFRDLRLFKMSAGLTEEGGSRRTSHAKFVDEPFKPNTGKFLGNLDLEQ